MSAKNQRSRRTEYTTVPSHVIDASTGKLVLVNQIVPKRRPRGTAKLGLPWANVVFTFPGQDYAYQGPYDAPQDQEGGQPADVRGPETAMEPSASGDVFGDFAEGVVDAVFQTQLGTEQEQKAHRAAKLHEKKQRRWSNWVTKTIPTLLEPYMKLLKDTNHFQRKVVAPHLASCSCSNVKEWPVVCVYGNGKSYRIGEPDVCLADK